VQSDRRVGKPELAKPPRKQHLPAVGYDRNEGETRGIRGAERHKKNARDDRSGKARDLKRALDTDPWITEATEDFGPTTRYCLPALAELDAGYLDDCLVWMAPALQGYSTP
jgi:hypothetical protein